MIQLAAKLLSSVEVSENASHQHEFHAGALRKALAFPEAKTTGELEITYLLRAGNEPLTETCRYSLYDSRDGKPRPPEYRLYFTSSDLQEIAAIGDILIVVRPDESTDLRALILPPESELGRAVARTLATSGTHISDHFRQLEAVIRASDLSDILSATRDRASVPDAPEYLSRIDQAFVDPALTSRKLPSGREMAAAAARMIEGLRSRALTPDEQIQWSLEAETTLFHHLEERLGQRLLDDLAAKGPITFAETALLVMKRLQSRKSRRGQSLQNHFATVLDANRIPYGPQCRTEGKETPDFVIPGCSQYKDSKFPGARLRMVACKSTIKDRWRQVLPEAARIPRKYLLTLDTELTDGGIEAMTAAELRIFLPEQIIGASYSGRLAARHLGTVAKLVEALQAALM